ncbi:MAG TPA: hypothetical protein VER78_03835, partial [Thermoanaerobaculia bacterium]|nr:hypothetical protein [Thermoanaerobaculia bacterium]
MQASLSARLAAFGGALRERGVPVVLSDEADALAALPLIDIFDRAEFKRALRVSLKIRQRDTEAFDGLFELFWSASPREAAVSRAARDRRVQQESPRKR